MTGQKLKMTYYADFDEETGLFCVFCSETGKATASYASMEEAQDAASKKEVSMTLDEFIKASKSKPFGGNSYVDEAGFEALYVRFGSRVIGGMRRDNVLDLANFTVADKGKGTFTALIARLRKDYPLMWLFVENVLNPRLPAKLVTLGFTKVKVTSGFEGPPCFVFIPAEKK